MERVQDEFLGFGDIEDALLRALPAPEPSGIRSNPPHLCHAVGLPSKERWSGKIGTQ
jgi:hypothetical protein